MACRYEIYKHLIIIINKNKPKNRIKRRKILIRRKRIVDCAIDERKYVWSFSWKRKDAKIVRKNIQTNKEYLYNLYRCNSWFDQMKWQNNLNSCVCVCVCVCGGVSGCERCASLFMSALVRVFLHIVCLSSFSFYI